MSLQRKGMLFRSLFLSRELSSLKINVLLSPAAIMFAVGSGPMQREARSSGHSSKRA
jgi:hypothetical protein